jgi:hypothetical protein
MIEVFKVAILSVSLMASPAAADRIFASTPSGATEMVFAKGRDETVSAISNQCVDARWTIVSSSNSEVTCEAPLDASQSMLGQMLMGNAYSTPPRRFFRFALAQTGDLIRVQASGWMELQMAFGQTQRTDFSGPQFQNNILNFLAAAGGQYPPGTTFPSHVTLGIKSTNVPVGDYQGLRIDAVDAGSAAERAGLMTGDIVTSIGGRRFKNREELSDRTARVTKYQWYRVDYIRNGKKKSVNVERQFRPPIAQTIMTKAAPSPAAPDKSARASPPQIFVADELEKLAKLKQAGILTASEFETQKAKVLAQ